MISFEEVVNESSSCDDKLKEYEKLGYDYDYSYKDSGLKGFRCVLNKNGKYVQAIKGVLGKEEDSKKMLCFWIERLESKKGEKLNESQGFDFLNEEEKFEVEKAIALLSESNIEDLDEGLIANILGGVGGFIIGPAIGKVIANALGVEKGILYDMLTSRLVSAALGSAVSKAVIR